MSWYTRNLDLYPFWFWDIWVITSKDWRTSFTHVPPARCFLRLLIVFLCKFADKTENLLEVLPGACFTGVFSSTCSCVMISRCNAVSLPWKAIDIHTSILRAPSLARTWSYSNYQNKDFSSDSCWCIHRISRCFYHWPHAEGIIMCPMDVSLLHQSPDRHYVSSTSLSLSLSLLSKYLFNPLKDLAGSILANCLRGLSDIPDKSSSILSELSRKVIFVLMNY